MDVSEVMHRIEAVVAAGADPDRDGPRGGACAAGPQPARRRRCRRSGPPTTGGGVAHLGGSGVRDGVLPGRTRPGTWLTVPRTSGRQGCRTVPRPVAGDGAERPGRSPGSPARSALVALTEAKHGHPGAVETIVVIDHTTVQSGWHPGSVVEHSVDGLEVPLGTVRAGCATGSSPRSPSTTTASCWTSDAAADWRRWRSGVR